MNEETMRSLIVWLVEWDSLGQERAAVLLLRVLEKILAPDEKRGAKNRGDVYNREQERQARAGQSQPPSGREDEKK